MPAAPMLLAPVAARQRSCWLGASAGVAAFLHLFILFQATQCHSRRSTGSGGLLAPWAATGNSSHPPFTDPHANDFQDAQEQATPLSTSHESPPELADASVHVSQQSEPLPSGVSEVTSNPPAMDHVSGQNADPGRMPQGAYSPSAPFENVDGFASPASSASDSPVAPKASLSVLDPDEVPTAEQLMGEAVSEEHQTIKTPALDKTQYASFTLNDIGLKGLAALDSTQEAGAFAVAVGCGYFHDPPELPGLAHMLEHMIFLGSSENSDATAWDEFISSKGGMHNAHTKPDVTTFYVAAPSQNIPELLGVFLEHLFGPALLPSQLQTEAMAVQYEHEKNVPDLERVALHVALRHLSDSGTAGTPGSAAAPISAKFGTGTLETLCNRPTKEGIDVLESMRRFHKKCYVPRNMSISIRMGLGQGANAGPANRLEDVIGIVSAAFHKHARGFSQPNSGKEATSFLELPAASFASGTTTGKTQQAQGETSGGRRSVSQDETSLPRGSWLVQVVTAQRWQYQPLLYQGQVKLTTRIPDSLQKVGPFVFGGVSVGTTLVLDRAHGWRTKLFVFWSAPTSVSNNLLELECQPSSIVEYLLDHPMRQGLFRTLKEKGYISSGEVFKHWTTRSSIFGLALETTGLGDSEHDDLMRIILQFTDSLQDTVDKSFVREYFTTYSSLSQLLWKFQDPLSPLDQVVASAETTLQYPSRPDLTLNTGVCLTTPSEDDLYREVRRLIEAMKPGKEVSVKLDTLDSTSDAQEVAEYGVKYIAESTRNIPNRGLKPKVPHPLSCQMPPVTVQPSTPPAVCLSSSTRVPKVSTEGSDSSTGSRPLADLPCVLLSDENLTILWHNGAPFNKPIVRSFIKARIAEEEATALNDAFGKIFTLILGEHAKVQLSEFHGCGIDLIVAYTGGSIVFELQSFSSIFESVIKGLGTAFRETVENLTEAEFDLVVAGLMEETSDFSASTSYELAMDVALSVVRQSKYSQYDLMEQLRSSSLTFPGFRKFISRTLTRTAVDCFLMGDIDASKAKAVASDFVRNIRAKPIPYEHAAGTKVLNLTSDVEIVLKNPIAADVNNALVSLYVSDPLDILESVLYSTIGELIRAPFFDTVRTVNMDGYVASASIIEMPPVSALGTIVQSSRRSPAELEQHVCTFLYGMAKTIGSNFTSDDFKRRMSWDAQSGFSREQSSFAEFFSGMVAQISSRNYCFGKAENFAHCPSSLKAYLSKLVQGASGHRVTVKLEAASLNVGGSEPSDQPQCRLPGQPRTPATGTSPVRQNPSVNNPSVTDESKSKHTNKLVEQEKEKLVTSQVEHQYSEKSPNLHLQNGFSGAFQEPLEVPPLLPNVLNLGASNAAQVPQPKPDTSITATGSSSDADLSDDDLHNGDANEEEALQYCKNERNVRATVVLTGFSESPQKEREKLITALQPKDVGGDAQISPGSQSDLWVSGNFQRCCTVHAATVKETSTCQGQPEQLRRAEIIQEDDSWVQLDNSSADNETASQQSAPAHEDAQQRTVLHDNAHVFQQQQQQVQLLHQLQQQLLEGAKSPTTAGTFSKDGFMSSQAVRSQGAPSGQQEYSQQQLQQARGLTTAEEPLNPFFSPAAAPQYQQQQLVQPRVAFMRRYGSVPSFVFTASGSFANPFASRRQSLLDIRVPRPMLDNPTALLLQVKQRRIQSLLSRRQKVEQQIKDIRQRVLLNGIEPFAGAAQA